MSLFQNFCRNKSWVCSAVYANPVPSVHRELWHFLKNRRSRIDKPWLILGDFNEVLLPSEVRGGVFIQSRASEFAEVVDDCQLIDLGAYGGKYTWSRYNQGSTRIAKRLDRAFGDVSWRNQFPEAFVTNLPRLHSDHSPILLNCGYYQMRGHRPFRFQAAWMNHDLYTSVVKEAWIRGGNDTINCLKEVTWDSVKFNQEVFGNVFKKKKELEARINGIQRRLESWDSVSLELLEKSLRQEYEKVLEQEELIWYQKSREKWVKFGDRNTNFFHTQTITRRRRNKIHGLHIEGGIWCIDEEMLRTEAQCNTLPI